MTPTSQYYVIPNIVPLDVHRIVQSSQRRFRIKEEKGSERHHQVLRSPVSTKTLPTITRVPSIHLLEEKTNISVLPMESAATIVKRNPWGSLPAPATQPCSFSSLMDEDLARKLQVEEGGIAEPPGPTVAPEEQTVVDDLLLAQTLQHEFDKENDIYLAAKEKHINGNSKGGNVYNLKVIAAAIYMLCSSNIYL